MERRRPQPSKTHPVPDFDLEALLRGMRRLVLHPGFVRGEIESPLLKRLTPNRDEFGGFAEAYTRARLADAALDPAKLAYLKLSLDTELDSARLRLT